MRNACSRRCGRSSMSCSIVMLLWMLLVLLLLHGARLACHRHDAHPISEQNDLLFELIDLLSQLIPLLCQTLVLRISATEFLF